MPVTPPPRPRHGANQEQSIWGRKPAADARERSSAAGARATVSQESWGRGPPHLGWYPELSSGAVRKEAQNEHGPVILWVQADPVPQEEPDGKPKA